MFAAGARVQVRDRPWRVSKARDVASGTRLLELEAADGEEPRSLTVLHPPEEVRPLSNTAPAFDLKALDSTSAWVLAHRVLAATCVRETGLLSGARFGRVAVEAYQAAPALRMLAKPRPSLLVADDVGLGKTIEAGLAMLELLARRRVERILIVTPPGLLLQWRDELVEKFGLSFTLIENAAGLTRVQADLPAGVSPWDALPRILTSMDFLKKETVRNRALRKRWDLVIVDEAHGLAESGTEANPYSTQRTRLGLALRDASRGMLLLTATPHNGQPHAFRSLLELVEPTLACLSGRDSDVRRRVEGAMVRRMKAQIHRRASDGGQELVFPLRSVRGVPVGDSAAEYRKILREVASYCSKTARLAGDTEDAELIGFAMQIVKKRALSSRAALERTIENRLEALKKEEAREAPPERHELRDLQQDLPMGESQAERTARRILRSAIPKEEKRRKAEVQALSGIQRKLKKLPAGDPKLDAIFSELQRVFAEDPTEKVIVFTEYRDTLRSLQSLLDASANFAGRYAILQGGLTPRQRRARQDAFEKPATRILLATDAASEGLNLQRNCRRILHCELPWNPNRMEQRNGRVDRYGQKREPRIRYFFYPDSPEEVVLGLLVDRLEKMIRDRVSTPDVLGVLSATGELGQRLTVLDPESPDVERHKLELVRHFEDRSQEFVRSVQPLLAASQWTEQENEQLLELLNTAEPLVGDDEELEQVVLSILGPAALQPGQVEGSWRIQVPLAFRGPGVAAIYPCATLRRSVAVRHKPGDVEYLTPLHPLIRAIAGEAARRLVHVYPGERGLLPRRLAARRVPAGERTSAIFTFLVSVNGGGELLEERILSFRVDLDRQILGTPETQLTLLREERTTGEVSSDRLRSVFEPRFQALFERASREAHRILHLRVDELRTVRTRQAAMLRTDLNRDLADRLEEIAADERVSRGLIDEETKQALLFATESVSPWLFQARRAAAQSLANERLKELDTFERIDDPPDPRPLGALFLVPEELET